MNNETFFPQRKHPRLKKFDYSRNGMYFITICTEGKRKILSHIGPENNVVLSGIGTEVEKQLTGLTARFDGMEITKYVIMPNHIHAVVFIHQRQPIIRVEDHTNKPTLCDAVKSIKALTSRACREKFGVEKIFQTSFYEHVIRCGESLSEIYNYIDSNPARWRKDSFFVE